MEVMRIILTLIMLRYVIVAPYYGLSVIARTMLRCADHLRFCHTPPPQVRVQPARRPIRYTSLFFIFYDPIMYRVLYVGISSEGVHPFPFRTRKLSPLEPMVLCHHARESR